MIDERVREREYLCAGASALDVLELPRRVRNALLRAGFREPWEIGAACRISDDRTADGDRWAWLCDIRNLGVWGCSSIRRAADEHPELVWAQPPDEPEAQDWASIDADLARCG